MRAFEVERAAVWAAVSLHSVDTCSVMFFTVFYTTIFGGCVTIIFFFLMPVCILYKFCIKQQGSEPPNNYFEHFSNDIAMSWQPPRTPAGIMEAGLARFLHSQFLSIVCSWIYNSRPVTCWAVWDNNMIVSWSTAKTDNSALGLCKSSNELLSLFISWGCIFCILVFLSLFHIFSKTHKHTYSIYTDMLRPTEY